MGDKTGIAWTDATWNPVTGCSKVSAGCKHCYAERVFPRAYAVQTVPRFPKGANGEETRPRRFTDVMTHPDRLDQPLRWRKPRRVFVNSMSDLFHDDVPDDFIAQVFAVMALSPHHTFQVLTKRPERMREFLRHVDLSDIGDHFYPLGDRMRWDMDLYIDEWGPLDRWPLPNVWMGTSAEDQATFDDRVPFLRETPAAVRFVSLEPMIGAINVRAYVVGKAESRSPWSLDWVIVGGESGPKARTFDIQWARDIAGQCQAAGVPVFVKQLGARPVIGPSIDLSDWPTAKVLADADLRDMWEIRLKHRAGADPSEWPEDLQVQQFPEVK